MTKLIIFDWDDTCYPTSWIIKNGCSTRNFNHKLKSYISYLDKIIAEILVRTMKFGDVVIITNASIKWVKDCIEHMPHVSELVSSYIPVISARDKYSKLYPTEIEFWKKNTFSEITFENDYDQVISIGDNESEYLALFHVLTKKYCGTIKSVKFMQFPNNILIIDQLILLNKNIQKIIDFKGNLDLIIKH